MSATFVAEFSNDGTGSANTIAVTLTGVTVGDYIDVKCTWNDGNNNLTLTCADSGGGTYSAMQDVVGTTQRCCQFLGTGAVTSTSGGSVTVTVSIFDTPGTTPTSTDARGIIACNISGSAGAQATAAAHKGQQQSAPGTGTDAITTPTATADATAGLAISVCSSSNSVVGNAGTGWTDRANAWASTKPANVETKSVSASASVAATYTADSGGGGANYRTLVSIYSDAAASGNTMTVEATAPVATMASTVVNTNSLTAAAPLP